MAKTVVPKKETIKETKAKSTVKAPKKKAVVTDTIEATPIKLRASIWGISRTQAKLFVKHRVNNMEEYKPIRKANLAKRKKK